MTRPSESTYDLALRQLRQAMPVAMSNQDFQAMISAKDGVLRRFQPLFTPASARSIRSEDILAFLRHENNRHWSGLHRQGSRICGDMNALRTALARLFENDTPLDARVDEAVDQVSGIGKGIVTALLTVAFPEDCGVWNNTSEAGLKQCNLWPKLERGATLGRRYVEINEVLFRLAQDLEVDLWTLDGLWWFLPEDEGEAEVAPRGAEPPAPFTPPGSPSFALEQHLQQFLWENWDSTALANEWQRYTEHGDPEAGYEYPCDIGRIDILARHKSDGRWLIIELKKGQAVDATIGQALRYMGWVKCHLTEEGEGVEGLVICKNKDRRLTYALEMIQGVSACEYRVDFELLGFPQNGGE